MAAEPALSCADSSRARAAFVWLLSSAVRSAASSWSRDSMPASKARTRFCRTSSQAIGVCPERPKIAASAEAAACAPTSSSLVSRPAAARRRRYAASSVLSAARSSRAESTCWRKADVITRSSRKSSPTPSSASCCSRTSESPEASLRASASRRRSSSSSCVRNFSSSARMRASSAAACRCRDAACSRCSCSSALTYARPRSKTSYSLMLLGLEGVGGSTPSSADDFSQSRCTNAIRYPLPVKTARRTQNVTWQRPAVHV